MVLDPELLKKAKAAASRMAIADRDARLARADYHTHIRRMHLAGASFREIADALALSHQRVQQIVDATGGTWWNRIWRTRNVKRDAVCTFCGRPPSEVAKLIAGPNVYICDECVALAEQAIAGQAPRDGRIVAVKPRSKARCSFCSKQISKDRPVASAADSSVCAECLRLCREILNDRAA